MIKKFIFLCFFVFLASDLFSQEEENTKIIFKSVRPKAKKIDSILSKVHNYKIISAFADTTFVDTTLTIQSYYKQNALGQDTFERQSFANIASPQNNLSYDFRTPQEFLLGDNQNSAYFSGIKQVNYYHLPGPITQFDYISGVENGQQLRSLFSANVSPNLNLFIKYNALRSRGNYQHSLISVGDLILGLAFTSKNKKYRLFTHYSFQDMEKRENGGLALPEQFLSGESQFLNREVIDVAFTDAKNFSKNKRLFLTHQYNFLKHSSQSKILFKHQTQYSIYHYSFEQSVANAYFGDFYIPQNIQDNKKLRSWENQLGAELVLPYLGNTYLYGKSNFYNYSFNGLFFDEHGQRIANRIKDTDYGIGGLWKKHYKGLNLEVKAEQMLLGTLLGTELMGKIAYNYNEKTSLTAGGTLLSHKPNFTKLLNQSSYKAYNWYHLDDFERQNSQTLFADLKTKWANVYFDMTNINNYTYYKVLPSVSSARSQSQVEQYAGNIQFFKLKLQNELKFYKFALENTILLQKVIQQDPILNVPNLVTRNTLYFSSHLFKKAMYLQTGFSLKYYSSYYADRYNPILSDFEVQTTEKFGSYPFVDFFLNAKVKTMRIFFGIEHLNSSFSGRRYLASPYYAPRDFHIRLGISWNFFT